MILENCNNINDSHDVCGFSIFQLDVTNYEQIEDVKRQINADMGIVDILVNNAGLMPQNSFRDGDHRAIQRVMDVNVMSHFWVIFICFRFTSDFLSSLKDSFVLDDENFH